MHDRCGFFDSGLGGLTILREVVSRQPEYEYVYLGDNAHMPYGEKDPEEIYTLTTRALKYLFEKHGCNLIILACNSAASVLKRIQQTWLPSYYPGRRVLGVIRPTAEEIHDVRGRINYLLATSVTVRSEVYMHELIKINPEPVRIAQVPCPELALAIERSADWSGDQYISKLIEKYLATIQRVVPAEVFLACTHYELIVDQIRKYLSPQQRVHSQGKIVAASLRHYLVRHPQILKKRKRTPDQEHSIVLEFTQLTKKYTKLVERIMRQSIPSTTRLTIEPAQLV
jgi:glutamate racemase